MAFTPGGVKILLCLGGPGKSSQIAQIPPAKDPACGVAGWGWGGGGARGGDGKSLFSHGHHFDWHVQVDHSPLSVPGQEPCSLRVLARERSTPLEG